MVGLSRLESGSGSRRGLHCRKVNDLRMATKLLPRVVTELLSRSRVLLELLSRSRFLRRPIALRRTDRSCGALGCSRMGGRIEARFGSGR
jgi:hypothetical protein